MLMVNRLRSEFLNMVSMSWAWREVFGFSGICLWGVFLERESFIGALDLPGCFVYMLSMWQFLLHSKWWTSIRQWTMEMPNAELNLYTIKWNPSFPPQEVPLASFSWNKEITNELYMTTNWQGLALWRSMLVHYLQLWDPACSRSDPACCECAWQRPGWKVAPFLRTLLLMWQNWQSSRILVSIWPSPNHCDHLNSELVERTPFFLYLCLFCHFAFQISKS